MGGLTVLFISLIYIIYYHMNMFFNENETRFQAGYDYEFFLLHEFGLNSFVIGIMLITLYLKTKKISIFP